MSKFAKECRATVIPAMRYDDAPAAIEWLCNALGFEKHAVYANPDGSIAHAQLVFGNGMVMLGSTKQDDLAMRQPKEIGNAETQAPYLVVADCDAIYATAKAAGAEMLRDLAVMDYGGKAFTCRDPEGHVWSVGSYDPWVEEK